MALALTLPLAIFGIPYAYAATTTSTYEVITGYTLPVGTAEQVYSFCKPGDFATGGGYAAFVKVTFSEAYPRFDPNTGQTPTGWAVSVSNDLGSPSNFEVEVVCMSPITVAGVGVPQFGSLYVAIALGAVVYFMLSMRFARRPTISPHA